MGLHGVDPGLQEVPHRTRGGAGDVGPVVTAKRDGRGEGGGKDVCRGANAAFAPRLTDPTRSSSLCIEIGLY